MRKKKYIVLARNKKIATQGLVTGKGHRSFGNYSALWISDPAEAREIDHQYGMKGTKDVAVTTDQQYEWSVNNDGGNGTKMDNIHHYTFQAPDRANPGGNERVRVKTADGFTWISRVIAEEEGLQILPQKRPARATRQEVRYAT